MELNDIMKAVGGIEAKLDVFATKAENEALGCCGSQGWTVEPLASTSHEPGSASISCEPSSCSPSP